MQFDGLLFDVNSVLQHDSGWKGKVCIDEESGIVHGRLLQTDDVITFEGKTYEELVNDFHNAVEDYIVCKKNKKFGKKS